MSSFMYIISNIIQPIFIIIGIGFLIQKKFDLHIASLSKIQIFVLVPALVFNTLYFSQLESGLVGKLIFFNIVFFCVLLILGTSVARLLKMPRSKEKAFVNAISLRNIGNYGIPLVALLFLGDTAKLAMSIHMVSVITCVLLMYTIGLYNASSGNYGWKDALKNVMGIPIIYVMTLAIILKQLSVPVPNGILSATGLLGQCVAPLALFTLGAQLAKSTFHVRDYSLYIGTTLRLLVSPLIAYGLALLFNFDALTTSLVILGAATPTAVNSLFLAIEFDGDSTYASQSIFLTTLLSAITVACIIFILTPLL